MGLEGGFLGWWPRHVVEAGETAAGAPPTEAAGEGGWAELVARVSWWSPSVPCLEIKVGKVKGWGQEVGGTVRRREPLAASGRGRGGARMRTTKAQCYGG